MATMILVDFQNCFILILLCFFSFLGYSLFFKKPKNAPGYDLPPSPPSLPIIGHFHFLFSSLTHKSLQKLSTKYGPLLHIRIFNVPVIVASSASVAYEIFKSHDVNVSSRGAVAIRESLVFGSYGIIHAPYGDYWKFMKKIIATKLLRPQTLERSRGIRAEELHRFYGSLVEKARNNESVGISREAMKLMNNTFCRMSMGRSFTEENGEAEKVRVLVQESNALTKKRILASLLRRPLEILRVPLFKKEIMSVSDRFGELLERILVEHEEKLEENHQDKDAMDELLAACQDEEAEYKITRNHIKALFVVDSMKPKNSPGYDLPPSPPSLPIIGHLHLLLSSLTHKSLQKLSTKYGPLLHIRIFNVPIILVSSASVAYEIFKFHDVNVSSRDLAAIDESLVFGTYGIVNAPYGDYWKFMKKIIATKLLRPQTLERSRGIRAEELHRFYSSLLEKARENESVEISKEAMKLMNNTLCRMMLGRCFTEENGEAEKVRGLVNESHALTKKLFLAASLRRPLNKLRIQLFKKEIMSVSDRFNELLEKILVEHKEKLNENHQDKDMMDVLLTACQDEYKITRNHIKAFFVELFIGGTDTSVQTTQWTMAEIINNHKVLEKLREEIDSVVGRSKLIQETDLPNLPYLQAVVKEGLRLHPPAPLMLRKFQERCEIKGFYIPEKTILVISAYAVMRDPDSWEDLEEFKPERFLSPKEDEKQQELKFLPFGGGRRGCPGGNLSQIIVGTAIGVMVQCFDWKIEGGKVNMEEAVEGMNLSMVHPLKCVPNVQANIAIEVHVGMEAASLKLNFGRFERIIVGESE
ncbi:hypothetical protein Bca4012_068440 [Brassica carinata]